MTASVSSTTGGRVEPDNIVAGHRHMAGVRAVTDRMICARPWQISTTSPVLGRARALGKKNEHITEPAELLDWTVWKDVHCRTAEVEDVPFLATMLGEAAVWRPDKATPTADEVMADPRYAMYLTAWPRQGDYGLIADQEGPVGAAWYRTYTEASHGYGFVAEDVPELSIAVIASRRHEGIGRRLLTDLIDASVTQGYPGLSLSVAEQNPARRLYESFGFIAVEQHGSSWTMVRHAARSNRAPTHQPSRPS
jgi:ribosomal protein S18 acetylase RimI-like enzyme